MTKYHFFCLSLSEYKNFGWWTSINDELIQNLQYNQNNNYAVNNVITGNKVQYTFYLDNEKNKNINKLNQKKMIMI